MCGNRLRTERCLSVTRCRTRGLISPPRSQSLCGTKLLDSASSRFLHSWRPTWSTAIRGAHLTIRPSRRRFAARLNSGVIRGRAIDILVLPQIHCLRSAWPRRKKQTARFGQHHVSAAWLSSAPGPIASTPRRDRCPSKSSPHCGLAPSGRRIGFGAANMAAHCRSSGAAFHGSRLSFAPLLPRLRFAAGAV